MADLRVGVRVVLSAEAKANGLERSNQDRVGTIVGMTRTPHLRAVRWDGRKTPGNYHQRFLRPVDA